MTLAGRAVGEGAVGTGWAAGGGDVGELGGGGGHVCSGVVVGFASWARG